MKLDVIVDSGVEETEVKIVCKEKTPEIEKMVDLINSHIFSIIGKLDGESFILSLSDIYYFEAVENKVFAYLETDVYEVNYKIADLVEMLSHTAFLQTSRTIILNLNKINKIKTMVNGRIMAELLNNEKMIITRVYANSFRDKLKGGNHQ